MKSQGAHNWWCTEYLGTIIFTRGSSGQLMCAPINNNTQVTINTDDWKFLCIRALWLDNTEIDLLVTYCASFSKKLTFLNIVLNVVLILAGFLPSSLETTIFTSIPRLFSIHDKTNMVRHFTVLYIRGKRQFYFPALFPFQVWRLPWLFSSLTQGIWWKS